ncbi:hypothetical protein C7449_1088 [Mycoplana dimorpha]|uniref:Uncharacterized protein n=1 Tax=Mycoplana dimorpha TaxID=28320 RepID=A0A2T5AZ01_MYCDI|nr:hypothetical protein C7449_1088 [Mycoplana dimorpha]
MSSNVQHVDFRTSDIRIIREMLAKAGYVTARLMPLTGPLHQASKSVLRRFMTGTMKDSTK